MRIIKKSLFLISIFSLSFLNAQLKNQVERRPSVEERITIPDIKSYSSGFNLFNPDRFIMNHSYSLSLMSFPGGSMSLGIYQNTMSYIVSKNLILNARLGFIHNPFHMGPVYNRNSWDSLIYGAEIRYRPTRNVLLNLRFDSAPSYYRYYPYHYENPPILNE